ncbi:DUF3558 family protein [Corynebacterium sp. LK2510]|uniref:DUF3558 family protein n=1 Tax=Corynebacterium sp. LK2510 TaxID=3110472 RepID=UPI0034CE3DAA
MRVFRPLIVVLPLLVAGCSVQGPESRAPEVTARPVAGDPVSEQPPAFHFESGDLVLGEFDPYTIGDNLFDPCAEISEEEFAAVGLVKGEALTNQYLEIAGLRSCEARTTHADIGVSLISNRLRAEEIKSQSVFVEPVEVVPDGFAFGPPFLEEGICDVGVSTVRGTFSVSASAIRPVTNQAELCQVSADILEKLYTLD